MTQICFIGGVRPSKDMESEDLKWVMEKTEKLIGRKITLPPFQIGVTIGTYTGPGALGCCFIRKYNA